MLCPLIVRYLSTYNILNWRYGGNDIENMLTASAASMPKSTYIVRVSECVI